MLVLTRRIGEQIVIGKNIQLTVLGVHGNSVRVGISAPASIRVDRSEVHDRRNEFMGTRAPSPVSLGDRQ